MLMHRWLFGLIKPIPAQSRTGVDDLIEGQARGRAELLETETRHLREMGQAAAGLAHETRNPLGLIRGWTQRLVQSSASAPEMWKQAEAVIAAPPGGR